MKKNKNLFCLFLFGFFNIFLFAQNEVIDSIPKDPLMPIRCEVINQNNEFLINENVNYLCYIKQIINLKNGFLISAYTKIDTFDVNFNIITSKETIVNKSKNIRAKQYYNLSLKRYFDFPICAGVHVFSNENIMINNKIIHISADGFFYYLFISDNLDGLELIDTNKINLKKKDFYFNKNAIDTLILNFLNEISFSEKFVSIEKYVDTSSSKKIFQNYCFRPGIRKNLRNFVFPYWIPFNRIKLINWQLYGVNPNDFNELFTYVVNHTYRLPSQNGNSNKNCLILKRDLLNISTDLIYTFRIYWKIEGLKEINAIILSIKKTNDDFKIIGINAFMASS